jgi:hypothetical protein
VATAPPSTAAASSSMQADGTVTVTAVANDMTITDEDVKAAWLADCERIYKVWPLGCSILAFLCMPLICIIHKRLRKPGMGRH